MGMGAIMGRVHRYILLGVLGSLAGCQLMTRDHMAGTPSATENAMALKLGQPLKDFRDTPEAGANVALKTAEELDKDGKGIEAIPYYEKARQSGGNKQQIARRLAVLYDEQGEHGKAVDEFKQLLQKNPKDADLLNGLGYCYYNQGNWAEAEKHLRLAAQADPKLARAWINLGMTLAQMSRAQESMEAFTNVVRPAQAYCNLAFILQTQKRIDEAKDAYRQALSLEPDLALARAGLAKLERTGPGAVMDEAARDALRQRLLTEGPVEVSLP